VAVVLQGNPETGGGSLGTEPNRWCLCLIGGTLFSSLDPREAIDRALPRGDALNAEGLNRFLTRV